MGIPTGVFFGWNSPMKKDVTSPHASMLNFDSLRPPPASLPRESKSRAKSKKKDKSISLSKN